jgi:hypothetical protein
VQRKRFHETFSRAMTLSAAALVFSCALFAVGFARPTPAQAGTAPVWHVCWIRQPDALLMWDTNSEPVRIALDDVRIPYKLATYPPCPMPMARCWTFDSRSVWLVDESGDPTEYGPGWADVAKGRVIVGERHLPPCPTQTTPAAGWHSAWASSAAIGAAGAGGAIVALRRRPRLSTLRNAR